jgi:hypothetical protein
LRGRRDDRLLEAAAGFDATPSLVTDALRMAIDVLTVVDPADDGVIGGADLPGVGMPRPVGPGGALVGAVTSWSVQ